MIKLFLDRLLHMAEVDHHAIGIQLLRLAIDGDDPVMSMQTLAFAGVGEAQLVRCGDLHLFDDSIHAFLFPFVNMKMQI